MKSILLFLTLSVATAAPLAAADYSVCAPSNAACAGYGFDDYKGAVCAGVSVTGSYVVACGGDWGCSIYYDANRAVKGCSNGPAQALAGDLAYMTTSALLP